MVKNNPYYILALSKVPLVMSMLDREQLTRTHGCFDRNYWCWKFSDFPGARFQEGVCTLAFLYSNQFPGNYLFAHEKTLECILSAMRFWSKIQHRDGSFDEAYPHEHSLAATAFTSFYVSEAFLLLSNKITDEFRSELIGVFSWAGQWLCRHDEKHGFLSNHLSAAAAALYNIYLITGEEKFKSRCDYYIQKIYSHQSREGWYEEYGGADIGYQTHSIFFLSKIWQHTKDETLLRSLRKSIEFISYFIHPDSTLGGEYGSRNTTFYFPTGFEILAKKIPLAGTIAQFMRDAVKSQTVVGLSAVDSYNFFPLLNNYLFAGLNMDNYSFSEELPFRNNMSKHFSDAGLLVKSTDYYYAILGVNKGGVIKIFSKRESKLKYSDCGYWGRTQKGEVFTSQSLVRDNQISFSENKVTVFSHLFKLPQKVFSPLLFILFRIVSLSLGRCMFFSNFLKFSLVKSLIYKREKTACSLSREITFYDKTVEIVDKIANIKKTKLVFLKKDNQFTGLHMGSSKYFQKNEFLADGSGKQNILNDLDGKDALILRNKAQV